MSRFSMTEGIRVTPIDETDERILVFGHDENGIDRVSDMGEGHFTAIWLRSGKDLKDFCKDLGGLAND
jgi:hypothetical protein